MDIAEEDIEIVLRSPQLPSTLLEAAIPIRHFREKWLGSGKKRVECLLIVSGVCLPRRFAVFSSSLSCGRDLGPRHKPTGPPPGYHARWKVESTKRDLRRPSRRGITIEKSRTEPGWRLSAPGTVLLCLCLRGWPPNWTYMKHVSSDTTSLEFFPDFPKSAPPKYGLECAYFSGRDAVGDEQLLIESTGEYNPVEFRGLSGYIYSPFEDPSKKAREMAAARAGKKKASDAGPPGHKKLK